MPHVPLKFKPGVRADDTALSSQAGYTDIDHVRWQRGELQPIGGYAKATQDTFTGIARKAFAWSDLGGDPNLAWGTAAKLYAYPGGAITDVTPAEGITAGLVDGVGGSGYGSGTYGSGTYGTSSGSVFRAQTWHLDQFGERLLALFVGGKLYEWNPNVTQADIVTNGGFATGTGWGTGTGWSIGSGVATKTAGVASNLSTTLSPAPTGGVVYRFTATVTRSAGEAFIRLGAVDVYLDASGNPVPITASGTVDFLFVAPAGETVLNIYGDAAFAGTFDNVSIENEIVSYPITQAPAQSLTMMTDPNGFAVLGGTVEADGDYNAMLVRWSDRGNVRSWVPDTDSLAGEIPLQGGSRIVGMIRSRSQNIVWSDTTVFAMQFTGDPTQAFNIVQIGDGCGLIGPHAAVDVDGAAIYMSSAGQFYVCNGQSVAPIECPVRNEVFANLAPGQDDKINGWYNAQFGEVWWHYADARDGAEVSRYVAFNPTEQYWLLGTFARSAVTPKGAFSAPIMLGTDSVIYYHETGSSADGNVFAAHAETGAFDISEGTRLALIRRFIPDFKDLSVGGLSVVISIRDFSHAPWREVYSGIITATTQSLPCRILGRQVKLRFVWSDYGITGRSGHITADVAESGAMR